MLAAAILVTFPLCMAVAALSDLLTMSIPNRASVVLLAAFLVIAPFAGLSWAAIGMHLAAGALVFAVCFALFAVNVMGGGDAKILTASAVWFGLNASLMQYVTYIAVFGGLLSLVLVVVRSKHDVIVGSGIWMPATMLHAKKVPYGVASGTAGFFAFPSSPLVEAVIGKI